MASKVFVFFTTNKFCNLENCNNQILSLYQCGNLLIWKCTQLKCIQIMWVAFTKTKSIKIFINVSFNKIWNVYYTF